MTTKTMNYLALDSWQYALLRKGMPVPVHVCKNGATEKIIETMSKNEDAFVHGYPDIEGLSEIALEACLRLGADPISTMCMITTFVGSIARVGYASERVVQNCKDIDFDKESFYVVTLMPMEEKDDEDTDPGA